MTSARSRVERFKALMGDDLNRPCNPETSAWKTQSDTADQDTTSATAVHGPSDNDLWGPPPQISSSAVPQWPMSTHSSKDWYASSDNHGPKSITSSSQKKQTKVKEPLIKDLKLDDRMGGVSPSDMRFCPIMALSKFPYKFLHGPAWNSSQAIASRFFDEGKFWARGWDLYYVRHPEANPSKVVVFVSEAQARSLIQEIDQWFPILNLTIPDRDYHPGFICEFDDHPEVRPHFLGHSASREEFDFFEAEAPTFVMSLSSGPPDRSLKAFKATIEEAIEVAKNKKKSAAAGKKQERILKQQDMNRQVRRAQRYLGLRPRNEAHDHLMPGLVDVTTKLEALKIDGPVAHPKDLDVVFVSIDVELYERNHNYVTEIGVATFDTRDIGQVPPKHHAEDWFPLVRARHFRIKEYMHLQNTEFVHGCADRFEFGKSEVISIREAPQTVASCFREPFSKPVVKDDDKDAALNFEKRNIIFIGHNPDADIGYLKQMGYDLNTLSTLVEVIDTALMWRSLTREINPIALGKLLAELDIRGWHLHNAGNDAVYTMQAMLAICVKDAQTWGGDAVELAAQKQRQTEERVEVARNEAEERARDNAEG